MKFYFAHPFRHRAKNRHKQIEIERATNIVFFNPFYDDDVRKSDTQYLDDVHAYNKLSDMDMHVVTDSECHMHIDNIKANILQCDAVLAVPEDGEYDVPFVIMLAKSMNRDVYVISEAFKDCPWFRVYSMCLFHSWGAFCAFFDTSN